MLGGVALHTALSGGRFVVAGDGITAAGGLVLLAAVGLRLPGLAVWAVALVGAGYVVGRAHHGTVDGGAALVGGALLLAAELAYWSIEDDARFEADRSLAVRRILLVTALVTAATVSGIVLVAAAALSGPAGLMLSAVGVAATLGAVATLLRLARPSA